MIPHSTHTNIILYLHYKIQFNERTMTIYCKSSSEKQPESKKHHQDIRPKCV